MAAVAPGGMLLCPEFLPAVARLLARAGLPLSVLVSKGVAAEPGTDPDISRCDLSEIVREALHVSSVSGDEAERYAAEALLRESQGREIQEEPRVSAHLLSLQPEERRRLIVPGAVILAVDTKLLRTGVGGLTVLDLAHLAQPLGTDQSGSGEADSASAASELIDVVIREVAYSRHPVDTEPHANGDAALNNDGSVALPMPTALRVEMVYPPEVSSSGELAADCAWSWAELLCSRCASPVFVAPAFHSDLAVLFSKVGADLVSLSARSGSRGVLSAKLVSLARQIRRTAGSEPVAADRAESSAERSDLQITKSHPSTALCLAAASASSAVSLEVGSEDAPNASAAQPHVDHVPLLLLQGRDSIPVGALVSGMIVDREVRNAVVVSLGSSQTGMLQGSRNANSRQMLLKRERLPKGRRPAVLPAEGDLLACLLLQRDVPEPGPPDEPVPSLLSSISVELENLLAHQVGLSIFEMRVPDGNPHRVGACRALVQACGESLRVDVDADGANARVIGEPSETRSAEALITSLRGRSIEVPERAAWRIIGKGGSGVRQLEQESGGVWVRVQTERKPCTVELFGVTSTVDSAEAILRERHAHASLEVPKALVPRIIGRGGSTKRDIEAASGGAWLNIETRQEPCMVEVIGEAPVVERALALLRERISPAVRIEVPRRLVPYIIGRKGANLRELEAVSGASLNVLTESEPCFVELSGSRPAVEKARQLVEKIMQQHAYDRLEVRREAVGHIVGRRGAALREVEAATGASVRTDMKREPCLIEVFGDKASVQAAMDVLKRRANPSRRRIAVPRHILSYVVGRAGAGTQEIEATSGACLHVEVQDGDKDGSSRCEIEAVGEEEQVEKAEAMLRTRMEVDIVEMPACVVPKVIGRAGATIKALQASTGATLHIPAEHGEICCIEVYGAPEARIAARTRLEPLAASAPKTVPAWRPDSNAPPTTAHAEPMPSSVTTAEQQLAAADSTADEASELNAAGAPAVVATDADSVLGAGAAAGQPEGATLRTVATRVLGRRTPEASPRVRPAAFPWSSMADFRRADAICEPATPTFGAAEQEAGARHQATEKPYFLQDFEIPDKLVSDSISPVPWAWRMPLALESPQRVTVAENPERTAAAIAPPHCIKPSDQSTCENQRRDDDALSQDLAESSPTCAIGDEQLLSARPDVPESSAAEGLRTEENMPQELPRLAPMSAHPADSKAPTRKIAQICEQHQGADAHQQVLAEIVRTGGVWPTTKPAAPSALDQHEEWPSDDDWPAGEAFEAATTPSGVAPSRSAADEARIQEPTRHHCDSSAQACAPMQDVCDLPMLRGDSPTRAVQHSVEPLMASEQATAAVGMELAQSSSARMSCNDQELGADAHSKVLADIVRAGGVWPAVAPTAAQEAAQVTASEHPTAVVASMPTGEPEPPVARSMCEETCTQSQPRSSSALAAPGVAQICAPSLGQTMTAEASALPMPSEQQQEEPRLVESSETLVTQEASEQEPAAADARRARSPARSVCDDQHLAANRHQQTLADIVRAGGVWPAAVSKAPLLPTPAQTSGLERAWNVALSLLGAQPPAAPESSSMGAARESESQISPADKAARPVDVRGAPVTPTPVASDLRSCPAAPAPAPRQVSAEEASPALTAVKLHQPASWQCSEGPALAAAPDQSPVSLKENEVNHSRGRSRSRSRLEHGLEEQGHGGAKGLDIAVDAKLLRTPPASPSQHPEVPTVEPQSRWSLSRLSLGLARKQMRRRAAVARQSGQCRLSGSPEITSSMPAASTQQPRASASSASAGNVEGPPPGQPLPVELAPRRQPKWLRRSLRPRLAPTAPHDAPHAEALAAPASDAALTRAASATAETAPPSLLHDSATPVATLPAVADADKPARPAPLFAPSASLTDTAWALALPTPARTAQKRPREAEAPTSNLRRCLPGKRGSEARSQTLFILDGLNILKSRNTPSWGSTCLGDIDLEWVQLEQACRYYTARGQKVSVYLPPLRRGHEEELERCRQEFGDIFVSCQGGSASDDRFMINTVKLYEDAQAHARGEQASPAVATCRIVTNDGFQDWKRRGDVDDAWVDRHCVRFAFGPAGFVPSELI